MTKGFTLIELLVVIAIVAVLATAVVLTLNPAELIRQGKDSTRISDLGVLNSTIGLFLADVTNPAWATIANCMSGTTWPGGIAGSCTLNASRVVTGTGWVNLNLTAISGGSPLGALPTDPANGATTCGGTPAVCFYGYRSSATVGRFKLVANMESTKFANGGAADVENTDGGTVTTWYETGSDLSL